MKNLLYSKDLKKYFQSKNYCCLSPKEIANKSDTVFITAGIQPILSEFLAGNIGENEKVYLSQPVIRTQFADSVSEGSAVAFINSTTAGFNIDESKHQKLVKDWTELFNILGIKTKDIDIRSKDYERLWGDLLVSGKKAFYFYNNIELGDTTFFTNVTKGGKNIGIETMSDVGFGLERIRWGINNGSYFDIYSDSKELSPNLKAYLSVIALLCVNDIKATNKNSGYRARQFSKKIANLLEGRPFNEKEESYLLECINYWIDWQEKNKEVNLKLITDEYVRNCNRYFIDKLTEEGYDNISGIDINVSREEFEKRLLSSNVGKERVKKLYRRE